MMAQPLREPPATAASPAAIAQEKMLARAAGYWPEGITVALALLAVIAIRLPEIMPVLSHLHPAILVAYGGCGLLLMKTRAGIAGEVSRHRLVRLALIYLAWCAATLPTALWKAEAFKNLQSLAPAVIMTFAIAMCFPTRRTVDRLQIAFVAFATGYAILMRAFGTNTWGRLEGFGMYDSNDIASVFAVSFPLAAGLLLRARGRARWVAGAGVVLLVLTVVASGSRGGTLALLAGAIVFTLGVRGSRRFWIIILFVAGGFATWATASQQFRTRMKSLTTL
jgi:hypothetical protein